MTINNPVLRNYADKSERVRRGTNGVTTSAHQKRRTRKRSTNSALYQQWKRAIQERECQHRKGGFEGGPTVSTPTVAINHSR